MTGARMICTLFAELERTNEKYGVVSMCIGTGMGAAGVFEREWIIELTHTQIYTLYYGYGRLNCIKLIFYKNIYNLYSLFILN